MTVLVLTRHGETDWSSRRLLTGWSDPPLSTAGVEQARRAGGRLAALGVAVERVYTSMLVRATETASLMTLAAGAASVPTEADWRLNERHLGRLEGLSKAEVSATWGNDRRKSWRDDDLSRPPPLDPDDPEHPRHDPRYRHVPPELLPAAERHRDTASRVLELWHERVLPDVLARRTVLVVAHLGPLRVLAGHLCPAGAAGEPLLTWPHAEPLLYEVAPRRCCPRAPARP